MLGYTKGKATSKYQGQMKNGKPNGRGVFVFDNNTLKLKGDFSNGEILNLRKDCLAHLQKRVVFSDDTLNYYVGNNDEKLLYYHAIIPSAKPKGAVVQLLGTWEST